MATTSARDRPPLQQKTAHGECLSLNRAPSPRLPTVRYPTTLHKINTGIIRLSALVELNTYYRGIRGARLPERFWADVGDGFRGGVEYAVCSCTANIEVATGFATNKDTSAIIFAIQPNTFCRPASIQCVSMYPHENEFVYPPRTAFEVTRDRVQVLEGVSFLVLEVLPYYRVL